MWAHQEKLSWTWLWAVSTHPQTVVISWLIDPQLSVFLWVHPGLLLLWMVASKVWDTEAKPVVFVCNRAARRALNIVAELESALVRVLFLTLRSLLAEFKCFSWVFLSSYRHSSACWLPGYCPGSASFQSVCTDLMTLSSAVLLPCTGFNVATWEEKSVCL